MALRNTEIYLVHDVHGTTAFVTPPDDRFGPHGRTKHLKIPILKDGNVALGKKKGVLLPAADVFDLFLNMPLDMEKKSPSAAFLSLCSSIALSLVRLSSFIPEVVAPDGGPDFTIRYVPLVHNEKIGNAIDLAKSLMPPVFDIRTVDNSVLDPEGINDILSLILTHIKNLTRVEDVSLPAALTARLRPYQERGYRWLCSNASKSFGSCMADDMGLGKTVQVIAFLLKLKGDGDLASPALVVCPTTIVGNWEKECRKFAPSLSVSIYHGTERSLSAKNKDVVITTYGTLRRDIDKFSHREWRAVIVDEAQNIKNPDTDQTRSVKSLKAPVRIAMSGTPVENRLAELWSIFDFINRGYLGHPQTFQKKYAVPIEKYRDRKAIERLKTATAPFILRRLKKDKSIIEDLPDKMVSDEYCYLTKEQAALYQRVVDATMETIEGSAGIQRKGLIFKLITSPKSTASPCLIPFGTPKKPG